MIKKILPYILIGTALVLLIVLLSTINARREDGLGAMHPVTITEALISIVLMTFGIAILLKRL